MLRTMRVVGCGPAVPSPHLFSLGRQTKSIKSHTQSTVRCSNLFKVVRGVRRSLFYFLAEYDQYLISVADGDF